MLVLVNPHAENLLGYRVSWLINKQDPTIKYGYLLRPPENARRDIVYFCDATQSSLMPPRIFMRLPLVVRWIIACSEFLIWARLNDVQFRQLRFRGVFKPGVDDVAYVFARRAYVDSCAERQSMLDRFSRILCNLSHFYLKTDEISANAIVNREKIVFLCEANCEKRSEYFRELFPWYRRDVVVVPFVPQVRFQVRSEWEARKLKAVSTGSYHKLSVDPDREYWRSFREATGLDTLHPLRRELDENRASLSDVIEVRNSFFWESSFSQARGQSKSDGAVGRLWGFLKRRLTRSQPAYFSFDIVDLYNSFVLAIVAEEAVGVPGIGAFEAMAAGAALVGVASGIYEDLGMREGHDYIGYDGTLEGLLSAVRGGLADPQKLAEIAKCGREFVAVRCSADVAMGAVRVAMNMRLGVS